MNAWKSWLWIALPAIVLLLTTGLRAADDTVLPRIEPLEPDAALEAFEVAPGYRVELVAAEPLVIDPVAFCFDARGRLVVVEMRDYSERPNDRMGRLRRLTDTDGDGQMDQVETLAEGLSWPTAVACWGDGYLVAAAPDILFITDSSRPVETWYSGFGRGNVQGLVNSLRWGPDNRIHGATSSSGATLRGAGSDDPLPLGRQDFAIDPRTRRLDAVPGGGQHGMAFNAWGEKFVCSNSDHLQQVLTVAGPAGRLSETPPLRRSIAADGPQADVFRASPVEPWRILRTRLRVAGEVPGPVEGGGRAAGYFTGATGVLIYDGDQWFADPVDQALVCDVGSNLVHRKRLVPDGVWWRGERIDAESELLRSRDIWFRPVQLGGGPDGALYIADMYREVIEHPASLPPLIKSQLDLNSGNDRGRIWRLVATDRPLRRRLDPLDQQPSTALVPLLDHPNAWHRRTAARLLYERQEEEVVPLVREVARQGNTAAGRVQALQTLAGLPAGLDAATLATAWHDPHPRVRSWAVRLVGQRQPDAAPVSPAEIVAAGEDPSIHVRFQLALHIGKLLPDGAPRAELLWRIANADASDPWIRWAVEGSLDSASHLFLDRLLENPDAIAVEARGPWIRAAVCQLLHVAEGGVAALVERLRRSDGASRDQLLAAVAQEINGLSAGERGQPLAEWLREEFRVSLSPLEHGAASQALAVEDRLALLQWSFPAESTRQLLAELLHPSQPVRLQQIALQKLVGSDAAALEYVLEHVDSMTPAVRETAWTVLGGQRRGLEAVIAALSEGAIEARTIPAEVRSLLERDADPSLREQLAKSQPTGGAVPAELMKQYVAAMGSTGDAARGRETFMRVCASCHRVGEEGRAVGPELRSIADKTNEQLVISILDPNREVDLRFQAVVLETVGGQILSGIVETETDASITILDSQGNRTTVPRDEIEQLQATGRSLMPERLHEEITAEAMPDLVAFLRSQATP